jgi:hypothetical protein
VSGLAAVARVFWYFVEKLPSPGNVTGSRKIDLSDRSINRSLASVNGTQLLTNIYPNMDICVAMSYHEVS